MAKQGLTQVRNGLEAAFLNNGAASFLHTFLEDINDTNIDYPYVVFVPTSASRKLNPREKSFRYQNITLYWFALNQDANGETASPTERSEIWDTIEESVEVSIEEFLQERRKWQATSELSLEYDFGFLGDRDDLVWIKAEFEIRAANC